MSGKVGQRAKTPMSLDSQRAYIRGDVSAGESRMWKKAQEPPFSHRRTPDSGGLSWNEN